jgi:hypothetical protein
MCRIKPGFGFCTLAFGLVDACCRTIWPRIRWSLTTSFTPISMYNVWDCMEDPGTRLDAPFCGREQLTWHRVQAPWLGRRSSSLGCFSPWYLLQILLCLHWSRAVTCSLISILGKSNRWVHPALMGLSPSQVQASRFLSCKFGSLLLRSPAHF